MQLSTLLYCIILNKWQHCVIVSFPPHPVSVWFSISLSKNQSTSLKQIRSSERSASFTLAADNSGLVPFCAIKLCPSVTDLWPTCSSSSSIHLLQQSVFCTRANCDQMLKSQKKKRRVAPADNPGKASQPCQHSFPHSVDWLSPEDQEYHSDQFRGARILLWRWFYIQVPPPTSCWKTHCWLQSSDLKTRALRQTVHHLRGSAASSLDQQTTARQKYNTIMCTLLSWLHLGAKISTSPAINASEISAADCFIAKIFFLSVWNKIPAFINLLIHAPTNNTANDSATTTNTTQNTRTTISNIYSNSNTEVNND